MGDVPKKSQSQPDKFRELARELGADEDEEVFKAKLQKVARAPHDRKASALRQPEED
jgi:hypothetical protein